MKVSGSIVNGSGYINHNERKFTRGNIDKDRSKNNLYIENESVEEAYNRLFKDTIAQYNELQKRSDRHKSVEGYLQELTNNKHKKGAEKPFYEVIVQIGDKDTCNCLKNPAEAENAKKALLKYYDTWKDRNPNLKTFNVSLHLDEETPHLHIDYIPVAEGCYKKGLAKRNSLSRALELQGLGKGNSQYDNSSVRWQEQERMALKEIALEYGFDIEKKGINRKHLTVQEYKKLQDETKRELDTVIPLDIELNPLGRTFIKNSKLESLIERDKLVQSFEKRITAYAGELELTKLDLNKQKECLRKKEEKLDEREELLQEKEKSIDKQGEEYIKLTEKLKSSFESATALKAQEYMEKKLSPVPLLMTEYKKLQEKEAEIKARESKYKSLEPYLEKAKDIMEKERQKMELEEKAITRLNTFLNEISPYKKNELVPTGIAYKFTVSEKNAFSVYENGVVVDIQKNTYHISDIAKIHDNDLKINNFSWTVRESTKLHLDKSFSADKNRIDNEEYDYFMSMIAKTPKTEIPIEGNYCGFSFNNKPAFKIYENGVVTLESGTNHSLSTFAKINLEKNTLDIGSTKWDFNERAKQILEKAIVGDRKIIENEIKQEMTDIPKEEVKKKEPAIRFKRPTSRSGGMSR